LFVNPLYCGVLVEHSLMTNRRLYDLEPKMIRVTHIFFDDAFEGHKIEETNYSVNNYVKQLVETVELASSAVYNKKYQLTLTRTETPYGGRLQWTLPGENTLTVHLKDNVKIRHRKRWSQVMYMYYFMGHKLMSANLTKAERRIKAYNTFVLALDGDIDFQPTAVQILVDRMKKNPRLGAACGRIHPVGSGPMVWYQKFEYAVSHWLQKSTEHMLGCVLCSPGCFSLFRGYALMDDNVMRRYANKSTEARHYVQYDQGEDRWLCTLLLQQGYRVEYCAVSDSFTNAPEGFTEFYRQRRRWTPSTIANIIDLLQSWKTITKKNKDITVLYLFYQLVLFISGMITPGTIFLLIVSAINTAYPEIPLYGALLINLIPVALFSIVCFKASPDTQASFAGFLSLIYAMMMTLVMVGLIKQAATYGFCSVSTIFLATVIGIFVTTAILHPMEVTCLFHGLLYFLCIPSMSMLLTIYSVVNLHDVSWGTREDPQAKEPQGEVRTNQILDLFGSGKDRFTSGVTFSLGQLFRCVCCPKTEENKQVEKETKTRENKWIDEPELWTGEKNELGQHEAEFWTEFIQVYLKPLEKNKEKEEKILLELMDLRNKSCLAFYILNILFIILVYTLETISQSTTNLSVKIPCSLANFKGEKIEPISVTFTLVFGLLLTVQFLAMLFHRYSTLLQITSITKLVVSAACPNTHLPRRSLRWGRGRPYQRLPEIF
ncbi:Chitin synthase, class 2, partial [Bulinus truncatus]